MSYQTPRCIFTFALSGSTPPCMFHLACRAFWRCAGFSFWACQVLLDWVAAEQVPSHSLLCFVFAQCGCRGFFRFCRGYGWRHQGSHGTVTCRPVPAETHPRRHTHHQVKIRGGGANSAPAKWNQGSGSKATHQRSETKANEVKTSHHEVKDKPDEMAE